MTTKDAINHLFYKIAYAKRSDEKWVDCIHIDALELAVRAMAEERKKGHWVVDEDGNIECSECGHRGVGDNYCEHCGADMRGETDAEVH